MKNILVSLTLSLVLVVGVIGQEPKKNVFSASVDTEVSVQSGVWVPQLKAYLTYAGKSKLGSFCWVQISEGYQQFYCGPTYSFADWISVAVGLGAETGSQNPFKAAGSVWVGRGDFSNLLVLEKGLGNKSSALWFRNEAKWQATEKLSLCIATQRYKGTGPCAEYGVTKKVSIKAEMLFSERAAPDLTIGVNIRF